MTYKTYMTYNIRVERFTGPLDLLLSLIEEKKLALNEIALSDVTEQFVQYVEGMEEEKPEEVADFLVIASRLLWLKAKALLPQYGTPEEEEATLLDQLRLYQQFVAVSRQLHTAWLDPKRALFRTEPPRRPDKFVAPKNVNQKSIQQSMLVLIERLRPLQPLPQTTIDATISLKQKIHDIRTLLHRQTQLSFLGLVTEQNKTDMIIGFLAILELMKQRTAHLHQDKTFSDIIIKRI